MKQEFTLSENPLRPGCKSEGGAGLYIVQHSKPVAIIEVDLVDTPPPPTDNTTTFTYRNPDGVNEHWHLCLRFCYQQIGAPDVDVPKLLNRAWHWYAAYLKWEDSNIDNGG